MKDFTISLLHLPATLLSALAQIDKAAIGIVFLVDTDNRLLASVSDGDIRRGLLAGLNLESPVETVAKKNCYYVTQECPRDSVLDIMQARKIQVIPVVNEKRQIVGVHTLHCIIGISDKPNAVVIMAGGKGTRLAELTATLPKPMLKVAGRPILERILLHLISHGFRNFHLAVNHLAHVIEDYFQSGAELGCSIRYLKEEEPLGSGGALSLLPDSEKADAVVLINGDLLTDVNLSEMLEAHNRALAYATMGVFPYSHQIPYGCIESENGKIVRIEEKPTVCKLINAGVYVLSPDAVRSVPPKTFYPITSLFETALEKGLACEAFPVGNDWIDIGQRKHLEQARGTAF